MNLKLFLLMIFATAVAAKYEIVLDRFEADKDSKLWDLSNLRVKKFNRTATVISGYYKTFMDVGNDFEIAIEASNLQGGQYKVLLQKELGGFCDLFWQENVRDEISRFREHINFTVADNECPFKAHTAVFNNYAPKDFGEYLPEYIPGNERWKVRAMFKKNGEVLGSYEAYIILRSTESMFTNISSGKK